MVWGRTESGLGTDGEWVGDRRGIGWGRKKSELEGEGEWDGSGTDMGWGWDGCGLGEEREGVGRMEGM